MVLLHAAEHGVDAPRVTTDGDFVVDVRVRGAAVAEEIAAVLIDRLGFRLDGPSPEEIGHRFRRGDGVLDLLAPEGFNRNVYTVRPARTVEAPGATQALRRAELVAVDWAVGETVVMRPNLTGALVAKAAAAQRLMVDRQKHLRDCAFLLTLVAGRPVEVRAQLDHKDRRRLLAVRDHLTDDRAACWLGLDSDDGINALSFLLDR
jgi:hypothetical protein